MAESVRGGVGVATAIVPEGPAPVYALVWQGEVMPDFESLLQRMAERPGMFVGADSLRALSHYLDGYAHGLRDAGQPETPLDGWMRWVELRFLISHPAWHWTRILLHVYGSDRVAMATLPRLYREFRSQREELGVSGIETEHRRRFVAEYGQDWHEPPVTDTVAPIEGRVTPRAD
jgi:hypothetical protein